MDLVLYPRREIKTTPLLHLKVLGAGGAFVESLSGYYARLARTHLQVPGVFFHRQLLWHHRGQPECIGEFCPDDTGLTRKALMNLPGAAAKWIALLTPLTEVKNLEAATFIPWGNTFPYQGFLKQKLAYCPHCYAEDGEYPYERLLWLLGPVAVCPVHRCRLLESCPHCGESHPPVTYRSNPGFCPRDSYPLKKAVRRSPIDSVTEDHADLWTARQCASLVEHFQSVQERYDLISGFRYCVEAAGLTDSAALGRFLGCSRITAYYWITGKVRPPLGMALHFCRLLGLNLLDLLRQRKLSIQMLMKPTILDGRVVISTRRSEPTDLEVRAWRILSETEASPPTLNGLATRLGTNSKYLRKHFPDLARQTIENHAAFRARMLSDLEQKLTAEIRKICGQLVIEGRRPTRRIISRRLSQPGLLRWPRLQNAANKIIQDFGLE